MRSQRALPICLTLLSVGLHWAMQSAHTGNTSLLQIFLPSDPFSDLTILSELCGRSEVSGGGCNCSVVTWILHSRRWVLWGTGKPATPSLLTHPHWAGCRNLPSSPVAHESEGQTRPLPLPCAWPKQDGNRLFVVKLSTWLLISGKEGKAQEGFWPHGASWLTWAHTASQGCPREVCLRGTPPHTPSNTTA